MQSVVGGGAERVERVGGMHLEEKGIFRTGQSQSRREMLC